MIDYSAAGFALALVVFHLYAPEDRGICDVLVANGKIIAVASNIPSGHCTGLHGCRSQRRSSAQVLLINTSI